MFVSMKTLLDDAVEKKYAVIAASAVNMEMVRACIGAADELKAPLILIMGGNQMARHANPELLIPMIKKLAESSHAMIATCLDHGKDYEKVVYAIRHGFSSVMIDGSALLSNENIALTNKVVSLCHPLGVSVEGEIGHVGMAATLDGQDVSLYTNPVDAAEFIKATGIDCLAVAVGTAHGKYPEGYVPRIDHERIRQIKAVVGNTPLALHGSSGSGDENIIQAVQAGINKINVATELLECTKLAMYEAVKHNPQLDYISVCQIGEAACRKLVMHWIELSGSKGRALTIDKPYQFWVLQGDCKNRCNEE